MSGRQTLAGATMLLVLLAQSAISLAPSSIAALSLALRVAVSCDRVSR
jgi:hypothetical protein